MPLLENYADFFSEKEFALSALIGVAAVLGIFDQPSNHALTDYVTGDSPTFLTHTSALPVIDIGITTLTMASDSYTIVETRPDGTGMTVLVLEAV
jgi:hypothetical protein